MHTETTQPVLCFGEVLWDIFPDSERIGGAPLNVAYHLQRIGLSATLVSRVGKDRHGGGILDFLKEAGLSGAHIQQDEAHETGKVIADVSDIHHVRYRFIDEAAWDFIAMEGSLRELASTGALLVYGSLVCRKPVSRQTLFTLLDYPFTKILDLNLRPPFYSRELVMALLEKADVVKLNTEELDIIGNWLELPGSLRERMEALAKALDAGTIIVTLGAGGSAILHRGIYTRADGFPARVVDTVGSGDAFLAAYIRGRLAGWDDRRILQYGNALGALVASRAGACPVYGSRQIDDLIRQSYPY
jgi:fructokinase